MILIINVQLLEALLKNDVNSEPSPSLSSSSSSSASSSSSSNDRGRGRSRCKGTCSSSSFFSNPQTPGNFAITLKRLFSIFLRQENNYIYFVNPSNTVFYETLTYRWLTINSDHIPQNQYKICYFDYASNNKTMLSLLGKNQPINKDELVIIDCDASAIAKLRQKDIFYLRHLPIKEITINNLAETIIPAFYNRAKTAPSKLEATASLQISIDLTSITISFLKNYGKDKSIQKQTVEAQTISTEVENLVKIKAYMKSSLNLLNKASSPISTNKQ